MAKSVRKKSQEENCDFEFSKVWFDKILSVEDASETYVSRIFRDKKDDDVAQVARMDFKSGAKYVIDVLQQHLYNSKDLDDVRKLIKFLKLKKENNS